MTKRLAVKVFLDRDDPPCAPLFGNPPRREALPTQYATDTTASQRMCTVVPVIYIYQIQAFLPTAPQHIVYKRHGFPSHEIEKISYELQTSDSTAWV